MPPHNGDRLRAEQDCGYLYRAENTTGRYRARLYLSHVRAILRCGDGLEQYGHTACGAANGATPEARRPVFPPVCVRSVILVTYSCILMVEQTER